MTKMNDLNANNIIQLLQRSDNDPYQVMELITSDAFVEELIKALQITKTPLTRQVLCDILGKRHEKMAISILLQMVEDSNSRVRNSAVDALAKIGDPSVGELLLQRFIFEEEDIDVRQMLAAALGAVKYHPAIPALSQALRDPNPVIRGCAAWSLGVLSAKETKKNLSNALVIETDPYAIRRITESIETLNATEK